LNRKREENWLAIKTSGHAALKENYFLDDGAYLAVKLLVEVACLNVQGQDLFSLIESLRQPAESMELRFSAANDNFSEYGQSIMDSGLEDYFA
jgi:hypothetical protein